MEVILRIAIIDSGLDCGCSLFKNMDITGITISKKGKGYIIEKDQYKDEIGHGTAIMSIFAQKLSIEEYFIIKLFSNNIEIEEEDLIFTLNYVRDHVECDILHISNGITACYNKKLMEELCNQINRKGTIIVSAFDNLGAISYPAAFKNVIGVDYSFDCYNITEYEFIENSIVNIRGTFNEQRLLWLNNERRLLGGNSFVAPYITIAICENIKKGIKGFNQNLSALKKNAKKLIKCSKYLETEKLFEIKNAVIFPFNKEIHSIARFEHLLTFNVLSYFDIKYSGMVGRKITELLNTKNSATIENIDSINWKDSFDCFILGHIDNIDKLLGFNYKKEIIAHCLEYEKNLICFDGKEITDYIINQFEGKGLHLYYPKIQYEDIPKNMFGKLNKFVSTILSVCGTSSRQGKFSLQLKLREKFIENDYHIGSFGTEPTSLLFGFDSVFPVGYEANDNLNSLERTQMINHLMSLIDDKHPDIIITGSQSNTVPLGFSNLNCFPFYQQDILFAVQPDACILCVNINDDISYIKRTINYIEGFSDAKVIALVLSPVNPNVYNTETGKKAAVDLNKDSIGYIDCLKKTINKKVFSLIDESDIMMLFNCVVDFLS